MESKMNASTEAQDTSPRKKVGRGPSRTGSWLPAWARDPEIEPKGPSEAPAREMLRPVEKPPKPNPRGPLVECACGCGAMFREIDNSGRLRQFVPGHNHRQVLRPDRLDLIATRAETPRDAIPSRKPWRTVVASWPIPWRERWGRVANGLAEGGVPFPDDETRAFDQVRTEREQLDEPPPVDRDDDDDQVEPAPRRSYVVASLPLGPPR